MTIIDILVSIVIFALAIIVIWKKFKSHPSDKYHNDSWRNKKK